MTENKAPLERHYAPIEVARILGLKVETVQRKCNKGQIKATKINTMWRITGEEIRRYLAEGNYKSESNS
jgi:excisionase family DNA binding protein